jgi:hypothetical protein
MLQAGVDVTVIAEISGNIRGNINIRTVTVWDSLKPLKIRCLFQMVVLSQQRLNDDC